MTPGTTHGDVASTAKAPGCYPGEAGNCCASSSLAVSARSTCSRRLTTSPGSMQAAEHRRHGVRHARMGSVTRDHFDPGGERIQGRATRVTRRCSERAQGHRHHIFAPGVGLDPICGPVAWTAGGFGSGRAEPMTCSRQRGRTCRDRQRRSSAADRRVNLGLAWRSDRPAGTTAYRQPVSNPVREHPLFRFASELFSEMWDARAERGVKG